MKLGWSLPGLFFESELHLTNHALSFSVVDQRSTVAAAATVHRVTTLHKREISANLKFFSSPHRG